MLGVATLQSAHNETLKQINFVLTFVEVLVEVAAVKSCQLNESTISKDYVLVDTRRRQPQARQRAEETRHRRTSTGESRHASLTFEATIVCRSNSALNKVYRQHDNACSSLRTGVLQAVNATVV